MICVVVLFRNAPQLTRRCLESLRASVSADATFLLVDDASDPQRGIASRLIEFRESLAPAAVRIIRFARQMHYSRGLAYALSLAPSTCDVLFISHDMMLTPACVATLREVAAANPLLGILRPTSGHMDWAKAFVTLPPKPVANLDDAMAFAADVTRQFGGEAVDWPMLIGDAMYIRRAVIDRIGVFDPRYGGFMGDIDYGVRARRAGFAHAIVRGAWLHHEGAGTAKEAGDALARGEGFQRLVEESYAQFRAKWGESHLPPHFRDMRREHFDALHALPPVPADQVIPPLPFTADIGEDL